MFVAANGVMEYKIERRRRNIERKKSTINKIGSFLLAILITALSFAANLIVLAPVSAADPPLPLHKFYSVEPCNSIQRLVGTDPQTLQVETVLNLSGGGFECNTIAFSPDGRLFGWNNTRKQLYEINLQTGEIMHIGLPTMYSRLNGMSFDKDGSLYALHETTDEVLSVDTTTSAVTVRGPLGFNIKHHGMAVNFLNNELYGVSGLGSDVDYLFRIKKEMAPFLFQDDFSADTTGDYTWSYQGAGTSKQWNNAGHVQMDGYSSSWDPAYVEGKRTISNLPPSGYAKIKFNVTYNGVGQSRVHLIMEQDENNWYRFAGTDATLGSSGYTEGVEKKVNGVAETYSDQNTTTINPGGDGWTGNQSYVMDVWWSPTKIRMAINGAMIRETATSNTAPFNLTALKFKAYRFHVNLDSIEIYAPQGLGEIIGPLGMDTGGVGVEFSPVTGELFTIRDTNKLMKINIDTGQATLLGTLEGVKTVNLAAQWPSTDDNPCGDEKKLSAVVKVCPTIALDTFDCETGAPKDSLEILDLNPKTNTSGEDCIKVRTRSNLPFWKTLAWTVPSTDYIDPGTGTRVTDTLQNFELKISNSCGGPWKNPDELQWIWDSPIQGRWNSPVIGLPGGQPGSNGPNEDIMYIKASTNVIWCDSAGQYSGTLYLDAHQN